jgi:hypothetical protein
MIADATKIRIRTVQSTINELRDKNILRKIQNGVYMINPTMLMMGNVPKRRRLIEYYDSLDAGQTENHQEL